MENNIFISHISNTLGIKDFSVRNTLKLFEEGCTIPFISRYRKEKTGSLDEVQISDIYRLYNKLKDIQSRKESIIESIDQQGKLTHELREKIIQSWDSHEIEDIYLPYKRRKKTKADVAREFGLEPLAKLIMIQKGQNIYKIAENYINNDIPNVDVAVQGAKDIIAEWVSEDQEIREKLRNIYRRSGVLLSKVIPKKKSSAEKYTDYFDFNELIQKCPSHRLLAILRGANEDLLKISLQIDHERAIVLINKKYLKSKGDELVIISDAISDSLRRLILPSVETQIINEFKEIADDEAIRVFVKNLSQLLLAAPLGEKAILAIDPGYRTGCKVVCLDKRGDFLEYMTIFPHPPQNQKEEAKNILTRLTKKYRIQAVGIGNGTASRETQAFLNEINFEGDIEIYMVTESGASIYSASDIAREEFPGMDVTVRGAISIGRRLLDPLAELVKIDPKSIGVGQYQHDVNQVKLKENLDTTIVSCVNKVGVNLNTASKHILTYVSGFGPVLAANVVEYRKENGDFRNISELKKVKRLGDKAFEQAAGFLRIVNGTNPLDNTGVHPESYYVVEKMAKASGVELKTFISNGELRKKIHIDDFISETLGLPTLKDILKEIEKPGLDPRGQAKSFRFDENVKTIDDLTEGLVVPGIVTNLTNFGAFVDIGVKQDGLLHISQISTKFIQNPTEVLSLGQELEVKITSVDVRRKRINLSLLF